MWLRARLFNTLHACLSMCFLHLQNCTQKLAVLNVNAYQNIPLAPFPASPYDLCKVNSDKVSCSFDQTFSSGRQRWWFVAVSKCESCKVPTFFTCICVSVSMFCCCKSVGVLYRISRTVVYLYLCNVNKQKFVYCSRVVNLTWKICSTEQEISVYGHIYSVSHVGDFKHYCSNFYGFLYKITMF